MDLFGDIGRIIVHATKSVATQKEPEPQPAPTVDLREVRLMLEQAYAELGRACYAHARDPRNSVSPALYERIELLEKQLDSLIARPEDSVRCPGCGAVQARSARYCSACGRRLPDTVAERAVAAEPDPDTDYCPRCGAVRTASPVCEVCGHSYTEDSAPAAPVITQPIKAPSAPAPEEPEPEETAED